MWKLQIIIGLLTNSFLNVNSNRLLITDDCDIKTDISLLVGFQYFFDQHYMTVIDDTNYHIVDALACVEAMDINDPRPVDIFNDWTKVDFRPEADPSSVSSYPATHGYLYRSHDDGNIKKLLGIFSSHNPRSKLMLSLPWSDPSTKWQEILRVAFDDFKMLNVAITSFVPRFERKDDIAVQIPICLYNPFSGDSVTRVPEFRCFFFTPENFLEEILNMNEFLRLRIENLQGFPLRVSIFQEEMRNVPVRDENGKITHYKYADGEFVSAMAKVMNFTPIYVTISEAEGCGYQQPNGSFTGTLGAIEHGKADFAANPILITNYNTSNSIFVQPITMTKLKFIIKKKIEREPLKVTIFSELNGTAKSVALFLSVILPIIYCFVHKMEIYATRRQERIDVMKYLVYVIAIQVSVSMKHTSMKASRMLVASVLFYALILNSLYQGTIVKNLNSHKNIAKITKIDELLDQNFAMSMQPILAYVFQYPGPNRISKHLNKVSKEVLSAAPTSDQNLFRLIYERKFAFLSPDIYTGSFLNNFYDNETGENFFVGVPESAFEFYVSILIPKSSPFFERFGTIVNLNVQSGLYQFDTKRALDENDKVWIQRVKHGLVPNVKHRVITIYDLQNAFKLFLAFNTVSFVVFLCELFINFLGTRHSTPTRVRAEVRHEFLL